MAIAGTTARRQLALATLMTAAVVVVGSAVPWLFPGSDVAPVESGLEQVQATVLFGAASLGLLSGRWAARTSVGFACAALLVLAIAGTVSGTTVGHTGLSPVMSTSGAALAVILLIAAAAAPEVTGATSLRQLLARECSPIALLALVALTPVVDAVLEAGTFLPFLIRLVCCALVAAGWLVAAIHVLRLGRPGLFWLPPVLMILSAEAVVRALVGVWSGFPLVVLGLKVLAGVFALVGAAVAARAAFASTTDGMTSMLQDLSAMQDEDSRRRADEIERLHEVRSVLAGLRAATGSLRKYEDSLDPGIRRRLEDALGAELNRLNQLIDPSTLEVTDELNLEAALMPVVLAEMHQGSEVTTDLGDICVRGTPADVATLVSDLLVNARVHAPGSAVRLTTRVDCGVVALTVRDWGPGLSATEAEQVFERSYRGARTIATGVPGSGLGLYNARRLARRMKGDLQVLAPTGGGCCFVATLPGVRRRDNQAVEGHEPAVGDVSTVRPHVAQAIPRKDITRKDIRARRRDPRP